MLKQRIATAAVLIVVLAIALTVGAPYGFLVFALAMVAVVIGEWLALLGLSRTTCVVVAGVMAFVIWTIHESRYADTASLVVWSAAALAWVALALALFSRGTFPSVARWRLPHALLAVFLPAACWFALADAYLKDGLVALLSILAMVWAADIGAYFAGRAFGKRKLAPAISPGKTWAGAVGGALAAAVFAVAMMLSASGSWFSMMARAWPTVVVVGITLALSALSVVGDLFESQLKRQRGVKDSGRLLPGHGGVFDRVDALLPVVPVALLLQRMAGA